MSDSPYRETPRLAEQLAEAQREIERLRNAAMARRRRKAGFLLILGGATVAAYFLLAGFGWALENAHASQGEPFNPWHPWLACFLLGADALTVGLVLTDAKEPANG